MQTAKTLIRLGGCQADLSLRWAHTHFVGFVMLWLISMLFSINVFQIDLGFYLQFDQNCTLGENVKKSSGCGKCDF